MSRPKAWGLVVALSFVFGLGFATLLVQDSSAGGVSCKPECYTSWCEDEDTCVIKYDTLGMPVYGVQYYKKEQSVEMTGCEGPYTCATQLWFCWYDCSATGYPYEP
jgi:hypothetical protein